MARILLVDDDELVREALTAVLERAGYTIECASNGREGLDRHEEAPFDVVITDIVMPEMEGIEMIRVLKQVSPRVPVIAISGGAQIEPLYHLRVAAQLGADETLAKPVQPKALVEAVSRYA